MELCHNEKIYGKNKIFLGKQKFFKNVKHVGKPLNQIPFTKHPSIQNQSIFFQRNEF